MRRFEAVVSEGRDEVRTAELVVVGGGMAGITAAARTAQLGATMALVEKSGQLGGSAAMSAGYIWTAPDIDTLAAEDPGGDDTLARILVKDFPAGIDWIRSLGVEVSDEIPVLGFGRGHQVDMAAYFAACTRLIDDAGGCILTGAADTTLVTAADGLAGVAVQPDEGKVIVQAPWVLLATGGFQANPELVARHVAPAAGRLLLRSHPDCTGDGITLGVSAGAALTHQTLDGFYGHLVPSPLDRFEPADYMRLAQYHSGHGVLLGRDGRRFTDESRGDHLNAQAVARQPGGAAYLVIDERIRREHVLAAYVTGADVGVDKMAEGGKRGARYASAPTLEALASAMERWGVPSGPTLATMAQFNAAVEDRAGDRLRPTRIAGQAPLVEPPFAALEVLPAITFTYGGLLTDEHGQVLDCRGEPIPGLLAAGADMGGVFHRGYGGGLARALVFGLRAAETAAGAGPHRRRPW
jgi:succinate dehydrogenase/fumarate reductase flavoprotein subunit